MIRREPIHGWRVWRLNDTLLESPIYGDCWLPGKAFSADCPHHRLPTPGCGCGVYALASRARALQWARWALASLQHRVVFGPVQLWGRVLPHAAGYRAEYAYPYALELLEPDPQLAFALRARYLVDVVGPVDEDGPGHVRS